MATELIDNWDERPDFEFTFTVGATTFTQKMSWVEWAKIHEALGQELASRMRRPAAPDGEFKINDDSNLPTLYTA